MNPELKKNDRVILLHMSGEDLNPGTIGTVTNVTHFGGEIQYYVKWEDKDGQIISQLALISGADAWDLEENWLNLKNKKRKITESEDINDILSKNISFLRFFDMPFFHKYLKMVRKSGITNMFQSVPYLWMGKNKIQQEMDYKDLEGEEYNDMLENANKSKEKMIMGVTNYLQSKNEEITIEKLQRYIPKVGKMILENYIILYQDKS